MTAQWDGVDYHLAYIPPRFNAPHHEDFYTEYMRRLFEMVAGLPWLPSPLHKCPWRES